MLMTFSLFLQYNNVMKRHAPTLSVITLTRNRAELLEKNFTSLIGQLQRNDEIIVIDNDSTDTTQKVISSYKRLLPIRSFRMKNGRYPQLYNAGIRHATKDIIVFLDDDCIASPSFIARVRKAHQTQKNIVVQGMTYSLPKGNIYAEIMGDHYQHFITTNLIGDKHLRILDNKNASLPRKLILRLNGFCEKLDCGSEDIELGIRVRSQGFSILFDPSIVAFHHERTTYRAFVAQHIRFARCESYLDRIVPKTERIGLVRLPKLTLQLQSALLREYRYITEGKLREAVLLPLLYLTLSCVRIYGYIAHI